MEMQYEVSEELGAFGIYLLCTEGAVHILRNTKIGTF